MTATTWGSRWGIALGTLLLCLAAGGADIAAQTGRATPTNPWSFRLRAAIETTYNDNILGLSDQDIDAMEDPNAGFNPIDVFGIDKASDVIASPSLGVSFERSPRKGLETSIGFSARTNQYDNSPVKNYQEYVLSVRQELNRSHKHRTVLEVGAARMPHYFLRRLLDEDESDAAMQDVHNAATYEKNRGYVELSQEIVKDIVAAKAGYALERRNYNFHFDERDSGSSITSLELSLYPLASLAFRIRPYYERERRDARGDVATSVFVDDDVDYDADMYGLDLRGLWGRDRDHRKSLRGYYQKETRDFNTTNATDPAHFGREDDITRYGLGYSQELGAQWRLSLSAYHREVDINVFTGEYEKNVVSFSFGYNFEHGFGSGSGPARDED